MTPMTRHDWLPGDGSLLAIREEYELDCIKRTDPGAVPPNPYQMARVGFLLDEIDARDAEIARLRAFAPSPASEPCVL